jgi:hypothetical protein
VLVTLGGKEVVFITGVEMLRNIYRQEEDSDQWQAITEGFPNGVPRFQSKDECEAWLRT